MTREKSLSLKTWEALNRRVILTADDQWKLERAKQGYLGECHLDELLHQFGEANWLSLKNKHLFLGGHYEFDTLLLTPSVLISFEVKNYNFPLSYENGKAYNGKHHRLSTNLFAKARLTHDALTSFLSQHTELPVYTVVAFVNPHNHPHIDDSCEVPCLQYYQLRDFIESVPQRWNSGLYDPSYIRQLLLQRSVPSDHHHRIQWQNRYSTPTPGIFCPKCHHLYPSPHQARKFRCEHCHYCEYKNEAAAKLINEVALLHCDEELNVRLIRYYSEHNLSKKLIQRTLRNHYQRVDYLNYKNPYNCR